jgi:membrane protease YdiL (CAAX protease family)
MNRSSRLLGDTVRPIALAILFTTLGFVLRAGLAILLDVEIPKLAASALNFVLAAIGAFYVFPKLLKQPFGQVGLSEYARRLGLTRPRSAWKHVVLGVLLAACTLGGMLISALLTGRYVVDWSRVSLSHIVFCLNPGVWEEFFYRGIITIVLLKKAKSVRQAALIQIVLFGLAHIKGLNLLSWVDVVSVMIIAAAFTYAAYKTRALVAGIVFHFLHDVFLFIVQVPDGQLSGFAENAAFFAALWIGVGVACLLIKVAADRLGVQAQAELYQAAQVTGQSKQI